MADVVILTPGVLTGDLLGPAMQLASQGRPGGGHRHRPVQPGTRSPSTCSTWPCSTSPCSGTVFGSCSPRVQIPNLLRLYQAGLLEVDNLVTQEYSLDQVQTGYDDLAAGINVRGVVKFDI